jgi:hypothetical protein
MVRRSLRPQERHPSAGLACDLVEAEGLPVEVDRDVEVADEEDGVVEAGDRDHAGRSGAIVMWPHSARIAAVSEADNAVTRRWKTANAPGELWQV